jgi:cholesterol oxidase
VASALRFTEALSGYMAAAEDHEAGYRAGRAAGARVRYRATARIEDLESFLRDPQHGADMTGVVDVAGLGRGMPIEEGRIELFCRREDRKVIAYHLPFRQGERRYLLRGEKHIQDDPGFDVWKDMTTLYAELLDLSSAPDSQPMAVGMLRIGPLAALRMLFTFRGARVRPTATAALRFLLFASRELRDPYGLLPW